MITQLPVSAHALGRIDGAFEAGNVPGATNALNTLHQQAANWPGHPDVDQCQCQCQWQRTDEAT
ncbi:hypothetical protein ACIOGZ_29880 [Kitasatospora sp. NPDC088160]|uniref:hypothetical protein n=1 Tax=Kitasatospora sp. NPDC088160 TaxID=3364072 RepID=UPI0037F38975